MSELEYTVCPVCAGQTHRSETDFTFGTGSCFRCFPRFVEDCFDQWQSRQEWDNQVIGGYRRAELAYHNEHWFGGPNDCDRCGDKEGCSGYLDYIVRPGGEEVTLCHECSDEWHGAADIEEEERGEVFMSPAAVAAFQWSGVESRSAVMWRQLKAERVVREQQGNMCADCGKPYSPRDYLVPWPPKQPDGFVMVCRPCGMKRTAAAGVEA